MKRAAERGREEMKRDGARSVRYDGDSDELQIVLNSGVTIRIPRMRIPGLQKAAQGDLADIELSPDANHDIVYSTRRGLLGARPHQARTRV
jgi:hypothetical protein